MHGHNHMIGAAIAGVAEAAGSAYLKKKGAKKAALAQEAAGALQASEFRKTEAELAPWRDVGVDALDRMAISLGLPDQYGRTDDGRDFSEFFKSPGYEFRRAEGIKAVERSAASRGMLQSGPTMKAVQRYGEGLASEEYGDYMSLLGGLSSQGAQVGQNVGLMRGGAAAKQGDYMVGAGLARQSGFDALAGGVEEIGSTIGGYLGKKYG